MRRDGDEFVLELIESIELGIATPELSLRLGQRLSTLPNDLIEVVRELVELSVGSLERSGLVRQLLRSRRDEGLQAGGRLEDGEFGGRCSSLDTRNQH